MAYPQELQDLAQSVYLAIKGHHFDDIASDEGQTYIKEVIDWANQFIDELVTTTDAVGRPVNWRWSRVHGYTLGSASEGDIEVRLRAEVDSVVDDIGRTVKIINEDEKPLSLWRVVSASQIEGPLHNSTHNLVARVGAGLVFSRPFNAQEDGGTIIGNITRSVPYLDEFNTTAISLIKPRQLLVSGIVKNASLPDIVQGGLSPSFLQRYNDLLLSAIIRNDASSLPDQIDREDFGYIGGVGF